MKRNHALRLPYRANQVIPKDIRELLPGNPVPLLILEPVIAPANPAGAATSE